nr:hypothetical protein [Methylomonas koyamae]
MKRQQPDRAAVVAQRRQIRGKGGKKLGVAPIAEPISLAANVTPMVLPAEVVGTAGNCNENTRSAVRRTCLPPKTCRQCRHDEASRTAKSSLSAKIAAISNLAATPGISATPAPSTNTRTPRNRA